MESVIFIHGIRKLRGILKTAVYPGVKRLRVEEEGKIEGT